VQNMKSEVILSRKMTSCIVSGLCSKLQASLKPAFKFSKVQAMVMQDVKLDICSIDCLHAPEMLGKDLTACGLE